MTDEQFAKLPLYARAEWSHMDRQIVDLSAANAELKGEAVHPEAPHIVTARYGALNSLRIPITNTVGWQPDPSRFDKGLDVRYEPSTEEWILHSTSTHMTVEPVSGNAIRINTRRKDF